MSVSLNGTTTLVVDGTTYTWTGADAVFIYGQLKAAKASGTIFEFADPATGSLITVDMTAGSSCVCSFKHEIKNEIEKPEDCKPIDC